MRQKNIPQSTDPVCITQVPVRATAPELAGDPSRGSEVQIYYKLTSRQPSRGSEEERM